MWIFLYFFRRLVFWFDPFVFFRFSIRVFDLIPDPASKNVKAWYRQSFHSKPPNIPAYRPGDPGVFHSRCQGFMDACHTPRSCSDVKFLEAHLIYTDYLIFCKQLTQFLIKTLSLMCCLCGVFSYFKAKPLE